jgi:hypothetical protein
LICGKELEVIYENDTFWKSSLVYADSWRISCNYGSKFDANNYILAMCDNCMEQKMNARLLIPDGNIFGDYTQGK